MKFTKFGMIDPFWPVGTKLIFKNLCITQMIAKYNIDIDNIAQRSDEELVITDPLFPPVDDELTKTSFKNEHKTSSLASEDFWDEYHVKQKRDWYLHHNAMSTYMEEHTNIISPDRTDRLVMLDLGCGTSTLSSMMIYKYKSNLNMFRELCFTQTT